MNTPYTSDTEKLPKLKKLIAKDELAKMLAADKEMMSATGNVSGTWKTWLGENARIHRPRTMPVVGKDAVTTWLASQNYSYKGEPMFSDIAASGDLGYTYGSAEAGTDKGYYARVWKRDSKGNWKAVVDIFSAPLPPPAKKEN